MMTKMKDLYLAETLEQLKEMANVDHSVLASNKPDKVLKTAMKLILRSEKSLQEGDEEDAFVSLMKFFECWTYITKLSDFVDSKEYYVSMVGKKKINTAMKKVESMITSLTCRYNAVQQTRSLGIANSPRTIEDNGAVETFQQPFDDEMPERVSITSLELHNMSKKNRILVLDTRLPEEFAESKLKLENAVNINVPKSIIQAGISCNVLGDRMIAESKAHWLKRDTFIQIVLLDWNTKTLITSCHLDLLRNILIKWDPYIVYKNSPVILEGGYEAWLNTYPTLTTNSRVCPPAPTSSEEMWMMDSIVYPMDVLTEHNEPKLSNPALNYKSPSNAVNVPMNRGSVTKDDITPLPTVNRMTKPTIVDEKRNANLKWDIHRLQKEKEAAEDMKSIIQENEERLIAENKSLMIAAKEREEREREREEQLQELKAKSRLIEMRKHKPDVEVTNPKKSSDGVHAAESLDNAKEPSKGKTPDEVRLIRDESGKGSSMKRSQSSPNMAKLIEDSEVYCSIKTNTPLFDRSNKPSSSPQGEHSSDRSPAVIYGNDVEPGLTGLKNLGNTCYMNSIVQCLSNTVELRDRFFNIKSMFDVNPRSKTKGYIFNAFAYTLNHLWIANYKYFNCSNLKDAMGKYRNTFQGYEQQDSHEFLTILIDWLHEDLNKPSSNIILKGVKEDTGEKAWGELKNSNDSIFFELFYGQQKSTVTCKTCEEKSVTFESFSNLSLPLPADKDRCTLKDCLMMYLSGEKISGWKCPRCKTARDATKKFDITRLPPILVLHFKRFTNDGWCRKRQSLVEFPINNLSMREYTTTGSEDRRDMFMLYGVSNHYGTMESGHYTAYCKNKERWYKFDDQEVSAMSTNEVVTTAAYIVFYRVLVP